MKCTRCNEQAFLRVADDMVLCADCWNKVEAHCIEAFENTSAVPRDVAADDAFPQPGFLSASVASNSVTPVELKSSPGVSAASVSPPSVAAQPFPDIPDCLRRVG